MTITTVNHTQVALHHDDDGSVSMVDVGAERDITVSFARRYARTAHEVSINWKSIGSVDIAAAKRFLSELQTAIQVAEDLAAKNAQP